ncbi:hypothetical protein V1264_023009 [Littorina saxatilis]|uniref:Uncharacterized protein n=1 Tax=Littorina saxatilis TaxID=31220 RepID=A0AAN9GA07_9CAEN
MVRTYERKTSRGCMPDVIRRAIDHYHTTEDGVKKTAALFDVPKTTLRRQLLKFKNLSAPQREKNVAGLPLGYTRHRQVFTDEQELALVKYLKNACDIYFGLCPIEVRVLAYQCAKQFDIPMPQSWSEKERAGADWFSGFMKRHKDCISIRTPEATSIGRATAFNRANIDDFFQKLGTVIDRYKFEAKDIWNVDETGVVTVQKPRKVVGPTGRSLVSSERGQLVTLCAAISADGRSVPHFFVFPRVKFSDHFLTGAPTGSKGSAHKSGWMTEENFPKFLEHFKHHVRPSKESPVLVLLDMY